MCKLKIRDDNNIISDYILKKYSSMIDENRLQLVLVTDTETIGYSIMVDQREKDIHEIKKYIDRQLKGNELYISEYLQRMYIFIGTEERQFSAKKK